MTKTLVSTHLTQGHGTDGASDFCFATDGELVDLAGFVCCSWDSACGCGRAFTGIDSEKATTTAVVADVDLNVNDLIDRYVGHQRRLWGELDVEDAELIVAGQAEHDTIQEVIDDLPVGSIVRVKALSSDNDPGGVTFEFPVLSADKVPLLAPEMPR